MTTRTAYPGTESVGDVLTKANFDKVPGGWIGVVQVTSNQGSITTLTDLTSLTLTVTYQTGRTYLWLAQVGWASTVASDYSQIQLTDGTGTQLQQTLFAAHPSAGNTTQIQLVFYEVAGSSGSVTRKLRGGRAGAATGTDTMEASSTAPAQLICFDLGL